MKIGKSEEWCHKRHLTHFSLLGDIRITRKMATLLVTWLAELRHDKRYKMNLGHNLGTRSGAIKGPRRHREMLANSFHCVIKR